ncbi:MAG: hypothetical protein HKN47_14960 [Pirellulaceae bacterium]|nr:hypothetical protein [Pirellulaceae bacterium]
MHRLNQRRIACWTLLLASIVIPCRAAETVYREDFNGPQACPLPAGWTTFTPGTTPRVSVIKPGYLQGRGNSQGGLVAMSCPLETEQQRLCVEFSLAVSGGSGRAFHVWTQQPDGRDASQLNLCVQNGRLQHFDGRTQTWETIDAKIEATDDPTQPVWHRIRAIVDIQSQAVDLWISKPASNHLPKNPTASMGAYRTDLPIGGISFVSGKRIAAGAWYLIDDLIIRAGDDLPMPGPIPETFAQADLPTYPLWSGPKIPNDPNEIPFAKAIQHLTIHRPEADDHKFLHGAAIVHHDGVLYANWANSPIDENGPHETLRGKRSRDGGLTWSPLEIVAPGFADDQRHSHGVLFVHQGNVWALAARFGRGRSAKKFPGLAAEAFVLDRQSDRWQSRGVVMHNCWPYDQPVKMQNGNFITGGQDKDGLPVVAISRGDDFTKWHSVLIPHPPQLAPSYAETTLWADGCQVMAVIRGGQNVAWVATSDDCGESWNPARPSNFPMPRAKAYLGKLSTGQLYLVSNFKNRDTLVVSVSHNDQNTLSKMWRVRHGKSDPPRFKGAAKSKQWSYPYGYEHDNKLYIVYSIGKEECGLSVIPIASLQ